jgi:myo-inositol-1(or 4)-monophosphatase
LRLFARVAIRGIVVSLHVSPSINLHKVEGIIREFAIDSGRATHKLQQANKITVSYKRNLFGQPEPVTNGDTRCQDSVVKFLQARFPKTAIVAEEGKLFKTPDTCFFTFDLDGSYNLAKGGKEWGVAIGYYQDRNPQVGVVYFPNDDIVISSIRKQGCWINGKPVTLGKTKLPMNAIFSVGPQTPPFVTEKFIPYLKKNGFSIKEVGSSVACLLSLLRGEGVLATGFAEKVWDVLPSSVAVQAAGGVHTDFAGSAINFQSPDLFAFGVIAVKKSVCVPVYTFFQEFMRASYPRLNPEFFRARTGASWGAHSLEIKQSVDPREDYWKSRANLFHDLKLPGTFGF